MIESALQETAKAMMALNVSERTSVEPEEALEVVEAVLVDRGAEIITARLCLDIVNEAANRINEKGEVG